MRQGKMPYGSSAGPHKGLVIGHTATHPAVREKAPGPSSKVITHTTSSKMPPSKGSWAHGVQTGETSPKTDSGGGFGNSSVDLHKRIIGGKG